MKGIIFGLVGKSGVGKTYLAEHIVSYMDTVQIIRSTTTRPRRGPEDDIHYTFLSPEEYQKRLEKDEFVTSAYFSGHWYGYERAELESVLSKSNGIFAIVEPVVEKIKNAGYTIKAIRVVSETVGRYIPEERQKADLERSQHTISYDLEIINSFHDKGHAAIHSLAQFIKRNTTLKQ